MTILKRWDDKEKATAARILGLCVGALALFLFIATLSYLFHWKEDMSLLNDPSMMDSSVEVKNTAGKLGYKAGHLMVCGLFGLGSFALLVILAAISMRLLLNKWRFPLLRTAIIAVTGAIISSLALAYVGSLTSLDAAFGGGLGGECGGWIVNWARNLFGTVVTGLFIVILILCWLFFSSDRFTSWFIALGEKKDVDETAAETEIGTEATQEQEQPLESDESIDKPEQEPVFTESAVLAEAPSAASEDEPVSEEISVPINTAVASEPTTAAKVPDTANNGTFEIVEDNKLNQPVKKLDPIDNRLDPPEGLPSYRFPSIDLLEAHSSGRREVSGEELNRNNNKIRAALNNYRIDIVDVKAIVGPTVTLYKVYPAVGVRINDIKKLQEDIALSLNAKGVRVVALSDSVGIEVANDYSSIVPLRSLLNDRAFRESKFELPVAIGYTITQKVKVFDLSDAPHLLIAGATKQGKSVGLNVIVSSLLFAKHPSELKFVFIDPKMVEFSAYSQLLKHYLAVLPDSTDEADERNNAIVKNPKNAEKALRSVCIEMDERYELMSRAGVNKITTYNSRYKERHLLPSDGHRFLPYLVVVVDEYADLTMTVGASTETKAASKSITNSIIRLAQKGRAAGIHVILATQRPSVDVISGIIKSNFPMRIAFRVASRVDSMTILDAPGAEKLIGKGDMLFSAGIETERIQCGYVSGDEIDAITEWIGNQIGYKKSYNTPYYLPSIADSSSEAGAIDMKDIDERFEEAAKLVVTTQKGSTSDLQRRLGMGYAKAGRVMDQLESAGIVGPQEGSKPRAVLVSDLASLQPILDAFLKQ